MFAVAAGILLLLCGAIGHSVWIYNHPVYRVAGFALLLPAGLAVTFLWPRGQTRRVQIAGLLLLAFAARLALLPHPADSDANRYLWEGRLLRHGESPYTHVTSAPEWAPLRDHYWWGMNQKGLRAIYPPLAEWTFAAVGAISYSPIALKLLFIAFDLGVVALLLAMLSARTLPLRLAGLYAFNPVPLIGFAGEAHFDAMLLFFVLLAVWLRERRSIGWSWVALAFAVQMKLVAVLLIPLFARRGGWRTAWMAVLIIALPFLPYWRDLGAWFEGVRHFGADLAFNGSIHALAWKILGDRPTAARLCGALLLVWVVVVAFIHRDSARGAFWALGGLIVLSPTVHYWYLSWALVFLPLFPSLAWLTLSGMMALYFLAFSEAQAGRMWGLPPWTQIVIWTTFGLVLARDAVIALRPLLRVKKLSPAEPIRTLAVIVPTLNESETLRACLDSIAKMSSPPDEVIVADGGSTDATREIAARCGTTLLLAERGRGRQIATGVSAAQSDAVLVVHADSLVAPDVGRRVCEALNANPAAIGGAVGQRFAANSFPLCIIEMLNEIRAVFFGVSFGDQGQFFRRPRLMADGGFPQLPLMEDVEFSLRVRARTTSPMLYLGGGILSSDRRWQKESWLKRCVTVVAMTGLYRLRRRRAAEFTAALYRKYYPEHV
ncbi:MAG: glycosyltransferase [Verrucomicrobiota bacterium]|nr:glycosyltransferase [Verrucomicrobiota bacterium]